jgi:hypothetical protein
MIYIVLVMALAISNSIQIFLPSYPSITPPAALPAPLWVIALINAGIAVVLYGGLGIIGLILSHKLGFAEIWDQAISNRRRLLIPGITGAAFGVLFIILDIIFSQFNGIGRLIHPPFPTSFFASLSAGIGEEILFRLFFISLWMWLISYVILRNKRQDLVFWVIAIISALFFAAGHLPSLMLLYNFGSIDQIPGILLLEIVLLNGVISIFAAYYMRKYGFLAAVSIHFWTDIIWHVIWGIWS